MTVVLLILVAALAFANGANDNSKGVATLVGFGTAKPRDALLWAALTTALGAIASLWLAGNLVQQFSKGLFEAGVALDDRFFVAVLVGACGWVMLANKTGMPVSTTHAITGALVGVGIVQLSSGAVQWSVLTTKFAQPLALSPLLATAVVYALAWPVTALGRRYLDQCACVVDAPAASTTAEGGFAFSATGEVAIVVSSTEACEKESRVAAVSSLALTNGIHWISGGMVGFARGCNDTPKIAALGIAAMTASLHEHGRIASFVLVTVAMTAGGLIAGTKVLDTLAKKLTPLPLTESLTASVSTAVLVSLASWKGLPVSTTHVSTGAIIGAGLKNDPRGVRWGKVGEIVLSWIVTLPAAAVIGAVAMVILARV